MALQFGPNVASWQEHIDDVFQPLYVYFQSIDHTPLDECNKVPFLAVKWKYVKDLCDDWSIVNGFVF